jgi:eukaryotic-like serine/threonine-protein kinase
MIAPHDPTVPGRDDFHVVPRQTRDAVERVPPSPTGFAARERRPAASFWLWTILLWALATASALAAASPGPTSDAWPMFRGGPALLGVAPGRLPDKPGLLWSFKTAGPVQSSAAIVEGRVFVGSGDSNLYALNLADGRKLWSFKTGGAVDSSPLVLGGRVFAGAEDGFLYAVQAADGRLDWKYPTGDKILGAPNWVPAPKGDGYWILVGSYDFKLHCLEAATGRTNWVYETGNYINGSPAVFEGQTVFGGCDAILHVLSLADGREVKAIEAGAYIAASVAVAEGHAYVGHYENEFLGVDLTAGKVLWRYKDKPFAYFSSPAVTSDRVLFGGRDKRLHCVDRATGKAVWTFATRGKVDSSPVVVGDRVVVGSDDGRLYVVSLSGGKELWSYEVGQPIGASPAVAGGRIVIGGEDGSVYCFGSPAR